jgi:hypothetical protein
MWSYRVDPVHWLQIGDTVLYRLRDYMDDSPYVTLLGHADVRDAIRLLWQHEPGDDPTELRCVPEIVVKAIDGWDAVVTITEDSDNHDYIFDVESLSKLDSPGLRRRRQEYQRFIQDTPNISLRRLRREETRERQLIYSLFRRWIVQTSASGWSKEFLATKRAMHLHRRDLACLGFFDGRMLVGYTVNEAAPNGYYQAFFGKADRRYPGLSIYIECETAKYMRSHYGSRFMNLQPDSGIPGLRSYKRSLEPTAYLKKYVVMLDRMRG